MTVNEESTYRVTATCTDSTGAAVTPKTATWTLTDYDGTVINSRTAVAIAPTAATMTIVLTGPDLSITSGKDGRRILLCEMIYDSATDGTDRYLKKEHRFTISNLVAVT
jgi:hypothetical protein